MAKLVEWMLDLHKKLLKATSTDDGRQ